MVQTSFHPYGRKDIKRNRTFFFYSAFFFHSTNSGSRGITVDPARCLHDVWKPSWRGKKKKRKKKETIRWFTKVRINYLIELWYKKSQPFQVPSFNTIYSYRTVSDAHPQDIVTCSRIHKLSPIAQKMGGIFFCFLDREILRSRAQEEGRRRVSQRNLNIGVRGWWMVSKGL